MSTPPGDGELSVTQAQDKVDRLGVQIEALQSVLVRLLQDVVQAEARLDMSESAQLVEANEQLVLAALRSQAEADTVTQALKDAEQSTVMDALTGLPNRAALLDRFAQVVASARRHGHRAAVLFVDLDRFKPVNDEHGHAFGDEVLRRVAARMLAAVREVDTVSRHGGDEFVILLAELMQPADAGRVVEKLLEALRAPITVAGRVLRLSASVGVAMYPEDGEQLATLVEHADAAMYEAKRGGAHAQAVTQPVHLSAPVSGPAAAPPAALAADHRNAEHRFRQMREANEQLVLAALSARDLQVAAEQAQRRQAAFVAAAADELRNPMAPIRIATGMLGRQRAEEPVLGRVQSIVEQQLARMSRLLGHVIAASGVNGTPALKVALQAVDPVALVDEVVAAYQPLVRWQHKQLDWHPSGQEWRVQGDPALLIQVVDNLLDNAVRFTHEGGHIEVALDLDTQSERLRLTVADDGIGITGPVLPHVFEPFVQDVRALGLHAAGIGIGLTVARELVRAHRGEIMAFSDGAGRGSRFVVTLPVVQGAALACASAFSSASASSSAGAA
jgi:diguanylate cyclase (GGDEF)-like protein